MNLVVAYDVVADKNRARLHKGLSGFLRPVQKSVFEGPLPAARLPELRRLIDSTIDHSTDTVRIYRLCRRCEGDLALLGVAAPVPAGTEDLVV